MRPARPALRTPKKRFPSLIASCSTGSRVSCAIELLRFLREKGITHGIATSGRRPEIDASSDALGVGAETLVVERGDVQRAKPAPDLFLNCQQRLGVTVDECFVVGDAVWDLLAARRARMLSIGLLSGGY